MRLDLQYEFDKLGRGVALDIEFGAQYGTKVDDVAPSDVSLVWTGMHRNTVCSKLLAVLCYFTYIGDVSSAGVAYGCYFIDVYAKICHVISILIAAKIQINDGCVFYNG